MAEKEKYVAYVSTYTMGNPFGIKIYDVDMENGRVIEKFYIYTAESLEKSTFWNIMKKWLRNIQDFVLKL